MSLIRKPQEIVVEPTIQALIYGQAGMGKTTLALSAPKPLLLDFDNGVGRVNPGHRCDTVQITDYQMALDVIDKEDLSPYETIVIDTGGKLLDMMAVWIIKNNSKAGKSNGTLSLQGFGERKAEFKNFCRRIRSLNKHLVFVAHRETQKNGDDSRYVPIFGGSSYDDLVTELDLVGYLEAVGNKRIITFNPTDRNDGKNTINMPPAIELPVTVDEQCLALNNSFFKDFVIKGFLKRLEAQKQLNEQYSEMIDMINAKLDSVVDAETANDAASSFRSMEFIGNLKLFASNGLREKANSLGLKLNKDKVYEGTEKEDKEEVGQEEQNTEQNTMEGDGSLFGKE